MRTPARLAAVAVGLGAVFAAAVGVGAAAGPIGDPPPPSTTHAADSATAHAAEPSTAAEPAPAGPGAVLDVLDQRPAAGTTTVAFRVRAADGAPLAEYGADPRLVAVRADLTGYQLVRPEPAPDGTWRAPLALTPGSWRLVADTGPADGDGAAGRPSATGGLQVAGGFDPQPLPAPSAVAQVDGYTVVLTGELTAGAPAELAFGVSRDGVPVRDLQPHLGGYGHLVGLREGSLDHLRGSSLASPGVEPAPGPLLAFAATAPSAGTYRLFLDFRHGDAVHTAAFTVPATATAADEPAAHGHGG